MTKVRRSHVVLSTRHSSEGQAQLSLSVLHDTMKSADTVKVASAFYDVSALKSMLRGPVSSTKRKVQLLLNGLGGARLVQQKSELREVAAFVRSQGGSPDIRLAFEPGMFHTKLFLARRRGVVRAWVGSANATRAALDKTARNEEILVRVDGDANELETYFDGVFRSTSTMNLKEVDDVYIPTSLIAFFRTGTLFFKPHANLQLTFNPFSELLLALPAKYRRRFANGDFAYADLAGGIGAFNIVRAARNQPAGALEGESLSGEKRKNANINPYVIETCLGYWVPETYVPVVQGIVAKAAKSKLRRYSRLEMELKSADWPKIEERYNAYLDDVKRFLRSNEIDWKEHLRVYRSRIGAIQRSASPFDTGDACHSVYNRAVENLTKHKNRLARPFVDEPMPEIWLDPVASADFQRTFFEYLDYASTKSNRPKAVKGIVDACAEGMADNGWSLEEAMEALLKKGAWDGSQWPKLTKAQKKLL